MFEQATLTNGSDSKRAWTTFLGLASQAALVSCAMLAPIVWPQVLPTARFLETLAPPLPPTAPRPLGGEVRQRPSHAGVVRFSHTFSAPISVPTGPIPIFADEPAGQVMVGAPTGFNGPGGGVPGGMPWDLGNPVRVAPPRIPEPVTTPTTDLPAATPRYKVGGNVRLGALLHKTEPQYPAIAKAARVSGDVELECVVGVDGHIHEVKVTSGNALLVRAAVDAAWQWVYAPSKLNDMPIEIVTILKFSFKLN